jgi:hypothetical protein
MALTFTLSRLLAVWISRSEYYDLFCVGNLEIIKVLRVLALLTCVGCGASHRMLLLCLIQNSEFLSLPLSLFNCFDPYKTERVNLYQVFLMLALYSIGAVDDKTRFCFIMFDTDHSACLQLDEFTKFVRMIAESLALIGEVREVPSQDLLSMLIDLCFSVRTA